MTNKSLGRLAAPFSGCLSYTLRSAICPSCTLVHEGFRASNCVDNYDPLIPNLPDPVMSSKTREPESAFTFLPQGALIQEFSVAGLNLVLSLPTAKHYATHNAPYFGETIGRTTNRIRSGKISNLNGKTYQLATNDAPRQNSLHGGNEGWGKKIWEGPKKVHRKGRERVRFDYLSKDGDEGYPGTVQAHVWYVAEMKDGTDGRRETVLEVEYEAQLVGDECEETVVGMTNHRYAHFLASSLLFAHT